MDFQGAGENFEFEVAVCVDCHDAGDSWVGVLVADNDVSADSEVEAWLGITCTGPQVPVVGHVHEVDGDVVSIGHGALRASAGRGSTRSGNSCITQ